MSRRASRIVQVVLPLGFVAAAAMVAVHVRSPTATAPTGRRSSADVGPPHVTSRAAALRLGRTSAADGEYCPEGDIASLLRHQLGVTQVISGRGGDGGGGLMVVVRGISNGAQRNFRGDEVLVVGTDADSSCLKVRYRLFHEGEYVNSISTWIAPETDWHGTGGISVTTRGGAGLNYRFTILANIGGHVRSVLDLIGEGGEWALPELVDVDNDGQKEIVHTPERSLRALGVVTSGDRSDQRRSEVWKWSPSAGTYQMVGTVAWKDRLCRPAKR